MEIVSTRCAHSYGMESQGETGRDCPLWRDEDLNWLNSVAAEEELKKEPRHLLVDRGEFNEFDYDCVKRCYDCEYYHCRWVYNKKGKRRKLTRKETIARLFDGLGKELSAFTSPIHNSDEIKDVWAVFFKLKRMVTGKEE